jgi:hypothetical protein
VDDKGLVGFRNDVYQHDKDAVDKMSGPGVQRKMRNKIDLRRPASGL